jgi:hypothetical protein
MTENLCAPEFTDQVIVLKDAAVRLKLRTRLEREDEMFVSQADKLCQIAIARDGRGMI